MPTVQEGQDTATRLSIERVAELYEGELSKFPLKTEARSDGVTLRLAGIVRSRGGYIVKASVANSDPADFFVRECAAGSAQGALASQAFVPMFVEQGRTREGYVVFAAPAPGAKVQVTIKEEGGKGRTLAAPVDFPF